MAEMPNVVATNQITSEWGNKIRDRTVQRYADKTERTAEIPSPSSGDLSYLEDVGDIAVYFSGSWRSLVPAGVMLPFAGATTPNGYLLCNGQAVSRTTYAALFAALGTAFGTGDGSTTFNVPDMRQRFPLGVSASGTGNTRGGAGGFIDHDHNIPSHTHSTPNHNHDLGSTPSPASDGGGTSGSAGSHTHSFSDSFTTGGPSSETSVLGFSASGQRAATTTHTHGGTASGTTGSAGSHTHTTPDHGHDLGNSTTGGGGTTGSSGGTTGTRNPPYLAVHFIVKT